MGLSYLDAYQASISNPNPLSFAPTYTSVNNLITSMSTTSSGTYMDDAANGLKSYLSPTGANPAPTVSVTGQYTAVAASGVNWTPGWYSGGAGMGGSFNNVIPTASFLANALNANDGVEFTLLWGKSSGHEVTLQSISLSGTNGTISFYDPWGTSQITATATNAGASATLVTADLELLGSGFLYVTYPTNNSISGMEPDPDEENDLAGDNNGQSGLIIADMVEAVPEPGSFVLAGTACAAAVVFRIIRRRKDRV